MAGGRGMRLMPLTKEISKAMVQINGVSLISYSLQQLKEVIPHIMITVGYKGSDLAKHVIEHGVSAIFNTDGKGNAWWLFNTLMKHLNEPVLVLTCDNIVKLNMSFLQQNYYWLNAPPCMVVPVRPVEGIEGDYIYGKDGIVHTMSRETPTEIYCSGIQVINPFMINKMVKECDDFYHVWERLILHKQLYYSTVYPERWHTVNTIRNLNYI